MHDTGINAIPRLQSAGQTKKDRIFTCHVEAELNKIKKKTKLDERLTYQGKNELVPTVNIVN